MLSEKASTKVTKISPKLHQQNSLPPEKEQFDS